MVRFGSPTTSIPDAFLNRQQASRYAESGHAAMVDTSFHGPLESAATLGMLKTFQLMKPAPENGRFLTVEHGGRNFMGLVKSHPWLTVRPRLIGLLRLIRLGYGIQLTQALLEQRLYCHDSWLATIAVMFAICTGWMLCSILKTSRRTWHSSWLQLREPAVSSKN